METDKPFTSPLIEELKKHLDSITREEFMQNMAAMRALFKAKENETDNNPLKLKVGKSYYLRHILSQKGNNFDVWFEKYKK